VGCREHAPGATYASSWLEPLQTVRNETIDPATDTGPQLLVRVDEFPCASGLDSPKFGIQASRRFHSVMAEAGVAHLLAVVPQWTHEPLNPKASGGRGLDESDRVLLAEMRESGVTFAQHGNTHRTRNSHSWQRSELSGLSAAALGELLDAGRRRLAEVDIDPRVLVPPFNRFDAAQWPVLERRYDVVTGGPESILSMGFQCGPQWRGDAVYLPCYSPLYATAAVIAPAVERLLEGGVTGWIPIVLHVGWEVDDDYLALRRLARLIAPYAVSWEDLIARKRSSASG